MKRVSPIFVASLFALSASVPAFAGAHGTASPAHATKLIASAGVHKTAVVSDDDSSDGTQQPAEPQPPSGSDDGD